MIQNIVASICFLRTDRGEPPLEYSDDDDEDDDDEDDDGEESGSECSYFEDDSDDEEEEDAEKDSLAGNAQPNLESINNPAQNEPPSQAQAQAHVVDDVTEGGDAREDSDVSDQEQFAAPSTQNDDVQVNNVAQVNLIII